MNAATQMRHPESEVLAAFVEGSVRGGELAEVTAHLAECGECLEIIGVVNEEYRRSRELERTRSRRIWMAAAAVVTLAITTLLAVHASRDPLAPLLRSTPRDIRFLEPRLTGGFAWAPLAGRLRGAADEDPRRDQFAEASRDVLRTTARQTTAKALHAAAAARLMMGQPQKALDGLEAIPDAQRDAVLWNDLAAAHLAASTGKPQHLSAALTAVDEAVRIDAHLDEALFNRALILEELHLRDAAAAAWRTYLEEDRSSGWAVEARTRLQRLTANESRLDGVFEGEK
jgi:tetratricopeptide (TPR) repeat protein